jgi:hypothetical protein
LRDADMLVDRRMQRDIYVPLALVQEAAGRTVVLARTSDEVSSLDLDKPSLIAERGEASGEGEPASIVTGTGDPAERGTWSAAADGYDLDPTENVTGGQTRPGIASDDEDQPMPLT